MTVVMPQITAADLADEEAFNSRFGLLTDKLNSGFDATNIPDGAVTRAKIGQGAVTAAKFNNTATWNNVTYQNGWSAWADAAWGTGAQYSRDNKGHVHLRGLVQKNDTTQGTVMFTLPVGYRPSRRLLFLCIANNRVARIDIADDGTVKQISGGAPNIWHSLANIHFRAV